MGKVLERLGGGLLSHNEHERDTMLCAMWLGTSETVDRSTRGVPRNEGSCVGKHHPAVFRRSWGDHFDCSFSDVLSDALHKPNPVATWLRHARPSRPRAPKG